MNTNPIFSIKNLKCEYVSGKTVLSIDELNINRGSLVFVLGLSGVGKSTFVETLGLMNKTIANNSDTEISFLGKGESIQLEDFWDKKDEEISAFRREHFSFIFQNTNLMSNFSAGENMSISRLINGASMEDVKEEVFSIMKDLDLDPEIYYKKVTELSGGQRQRIAFVRAVIAEFSILFGDEPTGNLDETTAFKLMSVLKSYLGENKTGIIVSHDIDLAIQFADSIIVLSRIENGDRTTSGEVLSENVIYKKDNLWYSQNDVFIENVYEFIQQKMNSYLILA